MSLSRKGQLQMMQLRGDINKLLFKNNWVNKCKANVEQNKSEHHPRKRIMICEQWTANEKFEIELICNCVQWFKELDMHSCQSHFDNTNVL